MVIESGHQLFVSGSCRTTDTNMHLAKDLLQRSLWLHSHACPRTYFRISQSAIWWQKLKLFLGTMRHNRTDTGSCSDLMLAVFFQREREDQPNTAVALLSAGLDWHLTLSSAPQNRLGIPTIRIPATPLANRWNLLNESSKLHGSPSTSRGSILAASWRYLVAEFGFGANFPHFPGPSLGQAKKGFESSSRSG